MKKSGIFKPERLERLMGKRYPETGVVLLMMGALFVFSGCAVGPDFKRPVVETPENYRFEKIPAEAMINLKWWELFEDPALYTLVTQALDNNRDLKIAAARVEQARATLGFTRADEYPGFYIEAGAGTGNFFGTRTDTRNSYGYVAPIMNWEIDFWGKYRRATESARAELMASEYALRTVQIGLISEVVGVSLPPARLPPAREDIPGHPRITRRKPGHHSETI
ncbi:MAG: TolC family protein [Deltaproteobacteria bacterium]|nr:TolC family protein [Deltaproteobacteria bacterium]